MRLERKSEFWLSAVGMVTIVYITHVSKVLDASEASQHIEMVCFGG